MNLMGQFQLRIFCDSVIPQECIGNVSGSLSHINKAGQRSIVTEIPDNIHMGWEGGSSLLEGSGDVNSQTTTSQYV